MPEPAPSPAAIAAQLGIGKIQRHLLLCVAGDHCCSTAASLEVWDYVKRRLNELHLATPQGPVYRSRVQCLRVCAHGPIAVVYPEGAWYHSVNLENAERIIQQHLIGGKVVQDLCFARNPLGHA
jgi:(2Fe-2S) ferredoxin